MEELQKNQESKTEKVIRGKRGVTISRLKRRFLKHIWLARFTVLGAIFLVVFLILYVIGTLLGRTAFGYYFSLAKDFLLTPPEKVQSFEGRTNILILGKGGGDHEAPDLTDTIIFTSISHKDPSITMISVSRDIWTPSLRAKLNSTYYWGNKKEDGGGLVLAKSSTEEVVGQPIHYGVVVDFEGFTKVIDVLGGIEVEVENSFIDERYPISGRENDECGEDPPSPEGFGGVGPKYKCRYETVSFESGVQMMDSKTALKFVRSRNAQGDEGTDFARSARQQKVINAILKSAMTPGTVLSRSKITALWEIFNESVETDIDDSAAAILGRRALQAGLERETHVVPEDLLINPPISPKYDNLYVFIPRADDPEIPGFNKDSWSEVHAWVSDLLK